MPVLLLAALSAGGCGYQELDGEVRDNIKPVVYITNYPPASKSQITSIDTTWSGGAPGVGVPTDIDTTYEFNSVVDTSIYLANPRLYWWGTDVDGRVDAFEYAVLPTDSLVPHPAGLPTVRNASGNVDPMRFSDSTTRIYSDSLEWIELVPGTGEPVHEATVFLYADIDTSLAIDQFLFVRAIDNEGLKSNIKFARYSRQNHPPETYISLDTLEIIQPNFNSLTYVRNRKYYSLPQATTTYPGIDVGWSGSDSLDFEDEQPPFEYHWNLYGPYVDYAAAAVVDSSRLVRTSDNPGTPRLDWTDETQTTFFNLRSGWYLFQVRARDDAFVADPNPALVRFQVVEPSLHKDFLLMDATNWFNGAQRNVGSIFFREGRSDSLTPDTVYNQVVSLFENQGTSFNRNVDTWRRQTFVGLDAAQPLPDRDVLAQYKAIVIWDEDLQMPLDKDSQSGNEYASVIEEYLNVGGRCILIGRNLFLANNSAWTPQNQVSEFDLSPADMGWTHFGVTRIFFPGSFDFSLNSKIDISDFLGTIPLDPDYPVVITDTVRTLYLSQVPVVPDDPGDDRNGDNVMDWLYIPDVNWLGIDRTRGANGIYQFNSYQPNTSPSQGRICGVRYIYVDPLLGTETYRTAVVTFPLWTMKSNANLRAMVRQLLIFILR